jgi:hypothetical protein
LSELLIDSGNAHEFGRALLDYAGAIAIESATFSLPGFRLAVSSDSAGYLDLCRRALVDDPRFAPGQQPLAVSVLDYLTHPDMPHSRWIGEMFGAPLVTEGLAHGGLEGLFDLERRLWQVYDPVARKGIEALAAPGQFAPWVASFPLRNFLHWACQAAGRRIIHAGTLGLGGNGVMLIGAGGAGKSGTTLSGILAGLDSVGDDYVAMSLDDAGIRAWPVMKLMKQDGRGLARLGLDPMALGLGEPNWQNKYEFDFERLNHGRRAESVALRAILLPRIAHTPRSRLTRAPAQAAMMGLAPSNLQQLPGGWREAMRFTGEIARRLPAYYLDLGDDGAEIAGTIVDLIEGRAG